MSKGGGCIGLYLAIAVFSTEISTVNNPGSFKLILLVMLFRQWFLDATYPSNLFICVVTQADRKQSKANLVRSCEQNFFLLP